MSATDRQPDRRVIHRSVLSDDADRRDLYVRGGEFASRTRLRVLEAERVSFATYFGALPAAYWRAHTGVRRVSVVLHVNGSARIEVRRTDMTGAVSTVEIVDASNGECRIDRTLSDDDAWLWVDAIGGDGGAELGGIRWETDPEPGPSVTVTVAITTFDRETDCIRLLDRLASDGGVRERLDRVVVVDQGTRRLRDAKGFDRVRSRLGEDLLVLEQANLGGSGGFSRGMAAAGAQGSTHVLLLDDDVDLEPESLLRLAAFAEHAQAPTIVGAHMLSLVEPTTLHSFGERIDRRTMWWSAVDPALSGADLATATVDETPLLSRPIDVDFNGWWMCLIPMSLVRSVGASMPFFIKWDDAEFGLRAGAAGVKTVSLPGAALWHMPWTAKDDGLDWQAYFQLRNRIVTALLHGGRGIVGASLPQDVNHLLCAQYGSVALRNTALRDVLLGPAHLDPTLSAGPGRAMAILTRLGQRVVPLHQAPPGKTSLAARPPVGPVATAGRAVRVIARQLRRSGTDPDLVHLSRPQGKWWALGILDGGVVEAASGAGVFIVRRDRTIARQELRRAVALRWRLWWGWRRLAREYQAAAPTLTSASAWEARFAGPSAP